MTNHREVHVVLPADVDDPAVPSGGNVYDRRLCGALAAAGWQVREIAAAGSWPHPDAAAREGLAGALAALPGGARVLLDGLVACAVPDTLAAQSGRLRPVVLVHAPLGAESGLDTAAMAALEDLERRALRAATAVIATSGWSGRWLVEHHGLPAARVHVAPPGVDPAPLAAGTDGASRLLCVASVTHRKGHDVLVEALARLGEFAWSCECVGALSRDPGYVAQVRRLIAAYRLDGRVCLAGPRTDARLAATYAAADLMVLASRAEAYGMVVTEALARGIPVLATDVDGVPEALGRGADGPPGMLVPPGDPAALAAALRTWLTDPPLRDRLRAAARDRRATLAGWEATSRAVAAVLAGVAT
jgi:glycosyltransferase involved in cell wall biosynthesis